MIGAGVFGRVRQNRLAANLVAASGGSAVFFGSALLRNLLLARLLGPPDFGAWTLGLVLIQYGQWSHLSVINAFRLDGARRRGAGELEHYVRLRRLAWTSAVAPALLVVAVSAAVALLIRDPGTRAGVAMFACLLLPFQLYAYAYSCLSTEERFTVSARIQTAFSVAALVLMVPLVWRFGFWGAVASQVVAYAVALALHRRGLHLLQAPLADRALLSQQVRIGLPLALNGIVYSLFVTLDRTLVAAAVGIAALGQYGLTALARSSLGLLPNAIGEVVYMRGANQYGELRERIPLAELMRRTDIRLGAAIGVITVLGIVWTPLAVRLVLPAYLPGVLALQVFLAGLYFLFPQFAGVYLTVVGRASTLLRIYVAATAVEAVAVVAGIWAAGLTGVAAGTAVASIALFLAVNVVGLRHSGLVSPLAHLARCASFLVAPLAAAGLAWLLLLTAGGDGSLAMRAALSAAAIAGWALTRPLRAAREGR